MVDMTHSPIFYFKSNPFNQAFLHLENIEKNIPLFFQKRPMFFQNNGYLKHAIINKT